MTFSIIVVCLNAGLKLKETVESILKQTEKDYEIIIKDGLSEDGSLEMVPKDERISVHSQADKGIYDAMNQALNYVKGDFVFFLNCGDLFLDENVLRRVKECIEAQDKATAPYVFYGNIQEKTTGELVPSNPRIDDFACYRNVPCHQACFYGRKLFEDRKFDLSYKVRADYEHFLWCYYKADAKMVYMPVTISLYEGGGFSETRENEKCSAREHKAITRMYMTPGQLRRYRWIMFITFAGLRRRIAGNPVSAGIYNRMKSMLYRKVS